MIPKYKILFLVQLPPPVHGASMINSYIQKSLLINNEFNTEFINISAASRLTDVGKFRIGKIFKLFTTYVFVLKALCFNRPDLVYITLSPHGGAFYKDAIFTVFAKWFQIKLVYHLHGKGIDENIKKSLFKRFLYKIVFKSVDVILLSGLLSYDIKEIRDDRRTVYFLPNGIPDENKCVTFNGDDDIIKILYLSNYVPSKGALFALKSIRDVINKTDKKLVLEMYGAVSNQSYYNEILRFINENELGDKVTVNLGIYGEEKINKMRSADIFIFPTHNECFPVCLLEAMMCGLCIVSTNVGAIPEIVEENKCGLLSNPGDIYDLTKNLLFVVENAKKRNDYSQNALDAYSNKYQLDVFERSLVEILKNILK